MDRKRIALLALIGAAGMGLGGCVDDYGYGGMSVGYGPGYSDYYGDPYWGWYGDYYYPGTGIYVYDRYRRAHRWNDDQRRYWQGRGQNWHPGGNGRPGGGPGVRPPNPRPNWHDFRNGGPRGGNPGGHYNGGGRGRGPRG